VFFASLDGMATVDALSRDAELQPVAVKIAIAMPGNKKRVREIFVFISSLSSVDDGVETRTDAKPLLLEGGFVKIVKFA